MSSVGLTGKKISGESKLLVHNWQFTLLDDVLDMLRMEKEAREARKRPNNEENNKKRKKQKDALTEYLTSPEQLIGMDVIHKFVSESDQEELWAGKVISYDHNNTNMHILVYTGDEETYQFDLTMDINNGDIWTIS